MCVAGVSVRRRLLGRARDLGEHAGLGNVEGAEFGGELLGGQELSGVAPVLGGQGQVVLAGPVGQDADDVAEVGFGVQAVESSRGDQGKDAAEALSVRVAAREQGGVQATGAPSQ